MHKYYYVKPYQKFFWYFYGKEEDIAMRLKIRELREEAQLTQTELAKQLSTSQRNVSNWETGANEPDLSAVMRLADVFGVSLDELFGRDVSVQDTQEPNVLDRLLVKKIRALDDGRKAALLAFLNGFCGQ